MASKSAQKLDLCPLRPTESDKLDFSSLSDFFLNNLRFIRYMSWVVSFGAFRADQETT